MTGPLHGQEDVVCFGLTRFLDANRSPPRIKSGAGFRWKMLWCLFVRIRIRRVRRLGEFVLKLSADRGVQVQPLRRNLLREPLVVDLLALAAGVERRGRG